VESRGSDGARRLLKEKGCEHYLDMALRFGTDEYDEDDFLDALGGGDDDDDDDDDEDEEAGGEAEGEEAGEEVEGEEAGGEGEEGEAAANGAYGNGAMEVDDE